MRDVLGGNKYYRNYVKSLNLKPNQKFLDVGCGPGTLLHFLPNNIEYFGIDMQQNYINYCHKNFGDKGNFFCERIESFDSPNWENYFDVINVHGLLHHIDDNSAIHLLKKCATYLKHNGFIVTVDTVFHKGQSKLELWFVSKDRGQNIKTEKEYLNLAQKLGFKVQSKLITNHIYIPYSQFEMRLQVQ